MNNKTEWYQKIFEFIKELKDSGKITDYNQIAFLFSSVKHDDVTELLQFLEARNINVYSPRTKMFFQRDEVRLVVGCLLLMFPAYTNKLIHRDYGNQQNPQPKYIEYYKDCILLAQGYLMQAENRSLLKWILDIRKSHSELTGTTDYAYTGLIYRLFEHHLFADKLGTEVNSGVMDTRLVRNIARFTQLIGKFEFLYGLEVLDGMEYAGKSALYKGWRKIDLYTEHLFNQYIRLLYDEGIGEYEDEVEYAPSGCVSFMTIHQSKGMEFPIVILGSLWDWPRPNNDNVMNDIEAKGYIKRPSTAPINSRHFFDFWRLYYTAFSRAQNLLVLTCDNDNTTPRRYFTSIYNDLPSLESPDFDITQFTFAPIRNVNINNMYSFTSHVVPYETCSRRYKFQNEFGFWRSSTTDTFLGTLVHETIEDIHKAVIRRKVNTINEADVNRWFNANYESLARTKHVKLTHSQRAEACNQVLRYVKAQHGDWSHIKQAEVKLSFAKGEYIIEGKIDLIRSDGDKVEIVDFKTGQKPTSLVRLEQYRRQLHVYAYLVEQCTRQKVSEMIVYYTGDTSSNPTISFTYNRDDVNDIMAGFDETVHRIMNKDFKGCATNSKVCDNCDFRFYCKNGNSLTVGAMA